MHLSIIFCAIVFTNVCDSFKHQLNYDYYNEYNEYYDEYDYIEYIKLNQRHRNPKKLITRYYSSNDEDFDKSKDKPDIPDESVRTTTINYFGPDRMDPNIGYHKFPASPMVRFRERFGVPSGSGRGGIVGRYIGLPFRIARRVAGLIHG